MGMTEDLAKLGKEIDSAKKNVSQLEGRRAEVLERLKNEFEVETIEEAEKLLETWTAELNKLDASIEADYKKLKENFSW